MTRVEKQFRAGQRVRITRTYEATLVDCGAHGLKDDRYGLLVEYQKNAPDPEISIELVAEPLPVEMPAAIRIIDFNHKPLEKPILTILDIDGNWFTAETLPNGESYAYPHEISAWIDASEVL